MMNFYLNDMWPELKYDDWKDTLDTLHMWTQIVGKVKLKLAPFINQWWEVAFYVTPSGLTTGRIPYQGEIFQVDFNFLTHILTIKTSTGKEKIITLQPRTVASFYHEFMNALEALGIQVAIWPVPVEVPNPIPFAQDMEHASYQKDSVTRWWRILVNVDVVFQKFRSSFRGKSSPIHFFWGSFDLNGTRFSGRLAESPKLEGVMGRIMEFAENEENFAFGFWPGDTRFPHPAFFAYMYPQPEGFKAIKPEGGASFNEQLDECILSYEIVQKSENPEKDILSFLESTYTASAQLAGWDIEYFKTKTPD